VTLSYMLDTNIVSALVHDRGAARVLLERRNPARSAVSTIVVGEILFGVEKRQSAALRTQVLQVLHALAILQVDEDVAATYGRIRAGLLGRGTPIGSNDLWIAAHALSLDATLVTANVDEFACVEGLRIENWLVS
jgi:tRNA(fMet)-specific endonuclease VapC